MKWMFFALLAVNLSLLAFQWLQHRDSQVTPQYIDSSVGHITLLNELEGSRAQAGRCLLIGPASDKAEAEGLVEDVSAMDLKSELIVQDVVLAPSYWVTYSIVAERDTQQAVDELKEKGYDSYAILSGPYKGMVSLGVFENIDLARRLKKRLLKIGYELEINEKKKVNNEFWVRIPVLESDEFAAKVAEIATSLNNTKKMREIFCKSVASENKFP